MSFESSIAIGNSKYIKAIEKTQWQILKKCIFTAKILQKIGIKTFLSFNWDIVKYHDITTENEKKLKNLGWKVVRRTKEGTAMHVEKI